MKTCSKCGFVGEDELFKKKTSRCYKCVNEWAKEAYHKNRERALATAARYRAKNPKKIKETAKKYRTNNPDKTKESYEKWASKNGEYLKGYRKKRYDTHSERLKAEHREWLHKHLDHTKEYRKRIYDQDPEKAKRMHKVWLATISGKKHLRKYNHQRRGLGHNPLNEFFEGSDEHHLRYSNSQEDKDNDMTIYVPRELHRSIPHNGNTGKNMREINIACLEWYFSNTHVESRNKKAVDLYLKYCMLPEPQWGSEQTTA